MKVVASGSLKLDYEPKPGNLFRSVEFLNVKHEEFLSRRALESLAIPEQKQSPEKSKMTAKQKQMQSRVRIIPYEQLPPSPCGDFGIFNGMQQFLEVCSLTKQALARAYESTAYRCYVSHATPFRLSSASSNIKSRGSSTTIQFATARAADATQWSDQHGSTESAAAPIRKLSARRYATAYRSYAHTWT